MRRYPFPAAGVGYSQNDPNTFPQDAKYSEGLVFGGPGGVPLASLPNSDALIALNNTLNQTNTSTSTSTTGAAAPFVNRDRFTVTPFITAGSMQVLAQNDKRSGLLVQNQSPTLTLFFNLGSAAGPNIGIQLTPGQGILFEHIVPNNFVTAAFVGGAGFGVVAEATRG
jgi:hypothetical protein